MIRELFRAVTGRKALVKTIEEPPQDMQAGPAEVVEVGWDDFSGWREGALSIEQITRMLRDPVVRAAIDQRVYDGLAREWHIVAPDGAPKSTEEAAEFCEECIRLLGGLNPDGTVVHASFMDVFVALRRMWLAYGWAIGEPVWTWDGGRWWWHQLKPRDPSQFELLADKHGSLKSVRVTQATGGQEEVPPSRFFILTHVQDWDLVQGQPALRAVYREWFIKDTAVRLRGMMLNKAAGWLVAKHNYPRGDARRGQLRDALKKVVASNAGLIPQDVELQVLEIASGSRGEFRDAIHDLNREILVGVTGASLGMMAETKGGSRAESTTHMETREHRVDFDCEAWAAAWTRQAVRQLCDANFDTANAGWVYPEMRVIRPDQVDKDMHSKAAVRLANLGLRVSKKALAERMGVTLAEDDEDAIDIVALAEALGGLNPTRQRLPGQLPHGMANMSDLPRRARHKAEPRPEPISAERVKAELDRREAALEADLETWFREAEAETAKRIRQQLAEWREDPRKVDAVFAAMPKYGAFVRRFTEHIASARKWGRETARAEVEAVTGERFQEEPDPTASAEAAAERAARDTAARTAAEMRKAIGAHLGMEPDDLIDLIATTFETARHRAAANVRTEIARSFNAARSEEFRTHPTLVHGWFYDAVIDDRTTPFCEAHDGLRYRFDDAYGASIEPPNHYQCRSIVRPVWWYEEVEWAEATPDDLAQVPAEFGGTKV